MTPQQIDAMKLALGALEEAHYKMEHYQDEEKRKQAITAIKEVLAEHAMRETQRLGQEIEQEIEQEPEKNICQDQNQK